MNKTASRSAKCLGRQISEQIGLLVNKTGAAVER